MGTPDNGVGDAGSGEGGGSAKPHLNLLMHRSGDRE